VKRYEMHLYATVSLLFCMLPKVVISHEEKSSTLAPMSVQDTGPRSLTENKMSDMSDRDGFILDATSGILVRFTHRITHLGIGIYTR